MSYLCKIETKSYGDNVRNFGCSRDQAKFALNVT
ncbi:inovirus-type Gp2 protein [Vibrio parahaemolyticus]|nr:inovirus-type Gp2 protein [Vibrio parahaemolyticus]